MIEYLKQSINRSFLVFWLLFLLECLAHSYFFQETGFEYVNSFLYLLAGLGLSFSVFWFHQKNEEAIGKSKSLIYSPIFARGFYLLFVLVMGIFAAVKLTPLLAAEPINHMRADMYPVIQAMCKRFLTGEVVYAPIPEIWNGFVPKYLPFMWLPFLPAEYFGFDYRWISFAALFLSLVAVVFLIRSSANFLQLVLLCIPAFLLLNYLFVHEVNSVTLSQEGIIVLFYLILGIGLAKRSLVLLVIALSLCLLSRYTLIFWIPTFLVFFFFFDDRKKAIQIGLLVFAAILVFFVIPWGWKYIDVFMAVPGGHLNKSEDRLVHSAIHIYNFLGLSKFFAPDYLRPLFFIQIGLSLIVPPLFFALWYRYRPAKPDLPLLYLCSLKLSLVIFFNFLIMPYLYLFYTSTLFSLLIGLYLINSRVLVEPTPDQSN